MITSSWTGLRIEPLDLLFFRDGRPFGAATVAPIAGVRSRPCSRGAE